MRWIFLCSRPPCWRRIRWLPWMGSSHRWGGSDAGKEGGREGGVWGGGEQWATGREGYGGRGKGNGRGGGWAMGYSDRTCAWWWAWFRVPPEAANFSLKNDSFRQVVLCYFTFLSFSWSDCSCLNSPPPPPPPPKKLEKFVHMLFDINYKMTLWQCPPPPPPPPPHTHTHTIKSCMKPCCQWCDW